MLKCEVIADLMAVYDSGEASPETKRLVEEHLSTCSSCSLAFGRGRTLEKMLQEPKTFEYSADGKRFISRTRRTVFALGIGGTFTFACIIALLERVIIRGVAGISIPKLPGSDLFLLLIGLIMTLVYVVVLFLRQNHRTGDFWNSKGFSFLCAIPLVIAAIATFDLFVNGHILAAAISIIILLAALIITFGKLPYLPDITPAVMIALILAGALLIGQSVAGIIMVGDFAFDKPQTMGHPQDSIGLEEAIKIDLRASGLNWIETARVKRVGDILIDSLSEAIRARYEGNGHEVYLTFIKSQKCDIAAVIYNNWKKSVENGIQICQFEVNVPGFLEEGHYYRTYSTMIDRAFSVWHTDKWVIILEATGSFAEASKLTKNVREIVEKSFEQEEKI
jgi:hypothetical protein